MAVTDVIPGVVRQPWRGSRDEQAIREYSVTYIVITDSPLDGPEVVLKAPGLPLQYSTYQFGNDRDLGATLKKKDAVRIDSELMKWEVNCNYNSRVEVVDFGDEDPPSRPPHKTWFTEPYQRIVTTDRLGSPIENVCHDEFDPPAMMDDSRLVLQYTRIDTTADMIFAFSFADAVNSDMFQGFLPGEAKVTSIKAVEHFEKSIMFWDVSFEIHFRRLIQNPPCNVYKPVANGWQRITEIPPWNKTLPNKGFWEFSGGQYKIIRKDGAITPDPQRLAINGALIDKGAPLSAGVLLSFEVYQQKPFAPLGIL
jgi:hypothetical protein